MLKENVIDILVNEKNIPETIKPSEVYVLHWTEHGDDGTVTTPRTSLGLFKSLKGIAEYLCTETCLETEDELRERFQNDGEEEFYVWDVIILEVK